ncbi:TrbC/VirB2 family protein [Nocardiopsis sp. CNR-923]|uniref:TrbC/VirB2 family protein n=1 Tax=Nocardiopsis sp. CNR-923 TaxID=1904965 RepID=UPI0021CCD0CF|nr:TrbC/VirB2 family protein [Nocardiopsis sp. CNR-923]
MSSELAEGSAHASLALPSLETSGNDLLGYVAGVGVILGVLALIIVGGRMIHANFTGDPWIAARGMADLPYVVLAVVLIIGSGSLTAMLFQGSLHNPSEDVSTSIQELVQSQAQEERESTGCGQRALRTDNGNYICPDDDGYEQLNHTVALSGPNDPRCTYDGAEDCYDFCYEPSFGEFANGFKASPCTPDNLDLMEPANWPWEKYHCPNLPESWWERSAACKDHPLDDAGEIPDYYPTELPHTRMQRYYACTQYPNWVQGNQREKKGACPLLSGPTGRLARVSDRERKPDQEQRGGAGGWGAHQRLGDGEPPRHHRAHVRSPDRQRTQQSHLQRGPPGNG